MKQITGLVLRGNTLDKEILLSRDQLIKWRTLHRGFPNQTIDDFVNYVLRSKIKVIKEYPSIKTTEKQLKNQLTSCKKLKTKLMKNFKHVCKDKLGKEDRVSVTDIELEVNPNRNISPRKVRTPADIPIFLRKAADEEFSNMLSAGILEKVDHATSWVSCSFPVLKEGSNPLQVRWVSDFNRAPVCPCL